MQMLSQRIQGLCLMALVFVTVIVALTIIQAVKHDWFIYSGNVPICLAAVPWIAATPVTAAVPVEAATTCL